MGVSDVVVSNLTTVCLVMISAVKAHGLVYVQEFSGVFVVVISTAVVGVISIVSIIWVFVQKPAKYWWRVMIMRVLKLVEGVSGGMGLLYGHLRSDSGFLNIILVPTIRMKSSNPSVVLLCVFFLSSSGTSPRNSVATLVDVEPDTPYRLLTHYSDEYSDNDTRGLIIQRGILFETKVSGSGNNSKSLKFSPVNKTVNVIHNDTEVRISTEDDKAVGIYKTMWLATTDVEGKDFFLNATFYIKKGEYEFYIIYIDGVTSFQHPVNKNENLALVVGKEWSTPNWNCQLLKK